MCSLLPVQSLPSLGCSGLQTGSWTSTLQSPDFAENRKFWHQMGFVKKWQIPQKQFWHLLTLLVPQRPEWTAWSGQMPKTQFVPKKTVCLYCYLNTSVPQNMTYLPYAKAFREINLAWVIPPFPGRSNTKSPKYNFSHVFWNQKSNWTFTSM